MVGDVRNTAQSCESVGILGQRVLGDGIDAFYELQFGDRFQSLYIGYIANYFEFDGVILGLVFT